MPHESEQMNAADLVFIAFGSNLGEPVRLVRDAMERLESLSHRPLLRSSLWQTQPVDCPPGSPLFINAVVGLTPHPQASPRSLLATLQALEKDFGRRPKNVLNEPRPLDLDIIAWGELAIAQPDLVLPHPRAHLRRFVMAPLAELAPDWVFPGQGKTVSALLETLSDEEGVTRVAPG